MTRKLLGPISTFYVRKIINFTIMLCRCIWLHEIVWIGRAFWNGKEKDILWLGYVRIWLSKGGRITDHKIPMYTLFASPEESLTCRGSFGETLSSQPEKAMQPRTFIRLLKWHNLKCKDSHCWKLRQRGMSKVNSWTLLWLKPLSQEHGQWTVQMKRKYKI